MGYPSPDQAGPESASPTQRCDLPPSPRGLTEAGKKTWKLQNPATRAERLTSRVNCHQSKASGPAHSENKEH